MNPNGGDDAGSAGGASSDMHMMMGMGRRAAIRSANRPVRIKHNLISAPHIQHPNDSLGAARFGSSSPSLKPTGF